MTLLSGCAIDHAHLNAKLKQDLQLAAPPSRAIDALDEVRKTDPATGTWLVQLEKHYEKLDAL